MESIEAAKVDAVEVCRCNTSAIDKHLVETVDKYARPEHIVLTLDNRLIPCVISVKNGLKKMSVIATPVKSAIVFGECGIGKEQIAP